MNLGWGLRGEEDHRYWDWERGWGMKEREEKKKDLPETQPRYSLNDLKEGKSNVLSRSWSPVILDNGVNQPFLLVTVHRTQLLYACCIISSFQQGKKNCPLFHRCKKKGPWPRDVLWKGKVELLWPKVARLTVGYLFAEKLLFAKTIVGGKKTQVFGLEP